MTTRRDIIKKIWSDSFNDSREYIDMYFSRVYNDEDALTLADEHGHVVSSMLLQRYRFKFQDVPSGVGMAYVAGAATLRQCRGRGHMRQLMVEALNEARRRGDMMVALIPATERLVGYYSRFGFSTVFYADRQNYTSLHSFGDTQPWEEVDDRFAPDVYAAFSRFEEESSDCTVLHTRRDFLNILDDLSMDGGSFVAIRRVDGSDIEAMAMGAYDMDEGRFVVKKVFGSSQQAREAAIGMLAAKYPGAPVTLLAKPGERQNRVALHAVGMARIVDVRQCLEAIAANHPLFECAVRITDTLLPDNTHIYRIAGGECTVDDGYTGRLDFDLTPKCSHPLFSVQGSWATGSTSRRVGPTCI